MKALVEKLSNGQLVVRLGNKKIIQTNLTKTLRHNECYEEFGNYTKAVYPDSSFDELFSALNRFRYKY